MRITTNHPDTKSNSNPYPNPTTKRHAVVSIQLNIAAWPTNPQKVTQDNVVALFSQPSLVNAVSDTVIDLFLLTYSSTTWGRPNLYNHVRRQPLTTEVVHYSTRWCSPQCLKCKHGTHHRVLQVIAYSGLESTVAVTDQCRFSAPAIPR